MANLTRRKFLERLGLGTSIPMLSCLGGSLFDQAMGQTADKRRAVFFLSGNGVHYDWLFTPPEVRAQDSKLAKPLTTSEYTWPAFLKRIERYRNRMLLIDGLTNQQKWGHTAAYAALSGFAAANGGSNEHGGAPGGITIDQYLGEKLAGNTPFKSILVGLGKPKIVFAKGEERPVAAITEPEQLFSALFGVSTDAAGTQLRQKLIFDRIRGGLNKLNGSLAGIEKIKLDEYLGALEGLEKRTKGLAGLTCAAPAAPDPAAIVTQEDRLEALTGMAALALACGATQVVGVTAGCGPSHGSFPSFVRAASEQGLSNVNWGYIGHAGESEQKPGMTAAYNYMAGVFGQMADTLAAANDGNGTVLDKTVMVLMSDNADQHHSSKERWPVVLLGDAGGRLKTDGRFIRYPLRGQSGYRALVDLYSSITHALGVPTDTFGKGGSEMAQGPLPEIMA